MGIGACAVLRVSLGVLAPAGGLGTGQMEGRGGVAGWGAGGHLREKRPLSTSRAWKQAGGRAPHPSELLDPRW